MSWTLSPMLRTLVPEQKVYAFLKSHAFKNGVTNYQCCWWLMGKMRRGVGSQPVEETCVNQGCQIDSSAECCRLWDVG